MGQWTEAVVRSLVKVKPKASEFKNLLCFLLEFMQHGHTAIPLQDEVLRRWVEVINDDGQNSFSIESILSELDKLRSQTTALEPYLIIEEGHMVWGLDKFKENQIACLLKEKLNNTSSLEDFYSTQTSDEQDQALLKMKRAPVLTLVGGPGTGKSHVIFRFLESLSEKDRQECAVVAPTGRAASRLKEVLQGLEVTAKTVHNLLRLYPKYGVELSYHSVNNPLPYQLVIVDETSMLDQDLFLALVSAMTTQARLILVGDEHQLPSVLNGAILRDIVDFFQKDPERKKHYLAELKTNRRILESEKAKQLANLFQEIRDFGSGSELPNFDAIQHVQEFNRDKLLDEYAEHWKQKINHLPNDPQDLDRWLKDVVLLLPLRRGDWGIEKIQIDLKRRLKPAQNFFEGMPLMVRSNQPALGLSNGDRGQLRLDGGRWEVIFPQSNMMKLKRVPLSQIQDYEDGFALTIHKSQGSEFDKVVLVIPEGSELMMSKELLYTAVTRTKKELALYASNEILKKCLENQFSRHTLLSTRLRSR